MNHARSLVAVMLLVSATAVGAKDLDLSNPEDNLKAFLKMRASLDGKDTVTWWTGQVFAAVPDERPRLLFGFEGMNVARIEKTDDGNWRMLSREYAVYKDPATGEILESWNNPWTQSAVKVFHVQNDPVNNNFGGAPKDGAPARLLPLKRHGNDVILGLDVPLAYPNPISPKEFPLNSTGEMYVGSEHFGFYARMSELANPKTQSAPISIAWFREAPWLPWMEMGDRPGLLIYSGYGKKLMGGIDELPAAFKAYIEAKAPEYLTAPKHWVQPNATSWTVYKSKVLDAKAKAAE
jgi:hypothetical protein